MSTVAEQLHQAREAKHLTVHQVAEITKIRGDHLRALEEGNFDIFCAPVYIRGFVRSYSILLKLDVPRLMAQLDAELAQTKKFAEPPPLSDHPRGFLDLVMLQLSKVDWRTGVRVLGVAVLLVGGLLTFLVCRQCKRADPVAGLKPSVYQPSSSAQGDTLPLPAPAPRR